MHISAYCERNQIPLLWLRMPLFVLSSFLETVSWSPSHLRTRIYMRLQLQELAVFWPSAMALLIRMQFGKIDTNESLIKDHTTNMELNMPSIAERFMGLKAALITNSEQIANLGERLGFIVSNSNVGLTFTEPPTSISAPHANVASELLQLLGLGDTLSSKGSNSYELVLLHVSGGSGMDRDGVSRAYVDWIDAIIGEVKTLMRPGTKASDHLYLSLILSYGAEAASQSNLADMELHMPSLPANMRALRPQQTYKMKDGKPVHGVRDHHPMLVVHQMDGVTRRDSVASLGFEEFLKDGCNLTILADRFLHELAFKLWKAPKYGA